MMNKTHLTLLSSVTLGLLIAVPAAAGTFQLEWDAVPQSVGYRVYYGTASGDYSVTHDAGPATQATLTGLEDCTEYFVAVKAYNASGESDDFSDELTGWARPEVHSFDPSAAQQGDVFTMNIWGANFESGATVNWASANIPTDSSGLPLVRFESVDVLSCNLIQALVTIESPIRGQRAMRVGDLDVAIDVENPDAVYGTASKVLDIRFNVCRADINQSDDSTMDRVDGRDLSWLAYAYGTQDGGERFNPDADLDGDGVVDGNDLAMLAPRFGLCWDGQKWNANACP